MLRDKISDLIRNIWGLLSIAMLFPFITNCAFVTVVDNKIAESYHYDLEIIEEGYLIGSDTLALCVARGVIDSRRIDIGEFLWVQLSLVQSGLTGYSVEKTPSDNGRLLFVQEFSIADVASSRVGTKWDCGQPAQLEHSSNYLKLDIEYIKSRSGTTGNIDDRVRDSLEELQVNTLYVIQSNPCQSCSKRKQVGPVRQKMAEDTEFLLVIGNNVPADVRAIRINATKKDSRREQLWRMAYPPAFVADVVTLPVQAVYVLIVVPQVVGVH